MFFLEAQQKRVVFDTIDIPVFQDDTVFILFLYFRDDLLFHLDAVMAGG